MTSSRPSAFRRFCAAFVAAALVLQPLGVHAAPIATLAEKSAAGAESGQAEHHVHDGRLGQHGCRVPARLRRRKGRRRCTAASTTAATAATAAASSDPLHRRVVDHRQSDPPIRSSDYNRHLSTTLRSPTTRARRPTAPTFPAKASNAACSGPWTAVYINGFAGYPGANTGGTINLADRLSGHGVVQHASGTPTDSEKATAFTDGSDAASTAAPIRRRRSARRGNVTAPSVAAGYNYPNAINPRPVALPRAQHDQHASSTPGRPSPAIRTTTRSSKVQFCSNTDAAGLGHAPCSDRWDPTTYRYVRYGTDAAKAFDPQAFTRVDIVPHVNARPYPSGRTYAQEMANFAKWYAFYRTRMLAMKTAGGIAFSALTDEDARVGFHTLWENNSATAGSSTSRISTPRTRRPGSPILRGSARRRHAAAGRHVAHRRVFLESGSSGLPGATDPLDPVTGQVPAELPPAVDRRLLELAARPQRRLSATDRTGTVTWPTLPGRCRLHAGQPLSAPLLRGADGEQRQPRRPRDVLLDPRHPPGARRQGQGLGRAVAARKLYGLVDRRPRERRLPDRHRRDHRRDADWPAADGAGGPDSIDDLWHAAVNSRGKYFNADNPQQLAESIVSALADFTAQSGTGTGSGHRRSAAQRDQQYAYQTSYEPGCGATSRNTRSTSTPAPSPSMPTAIR